MAQKASSRRPNRQRTVTRAGAEIQAWEDDPGPPDEARTPLRQPAPSLPGKRLSTKIGGRAPSVRVYDVGTSSFRYWTAAEALRRSAELWADLIPRLGWYPTVGANLKVALDEGEDFNAYYDRAGLHFFHGTVAGHPVYSGESPDVVSHELGHAVLDALRPQLWDAASDEVAAFHEAFGDVSAMLSALQLQSFRDEVLASTTGRLERSSRLSRLAEQLGHAIRTIQPDAVDADSLRNAANSFFYDEPTALPPTAPATMLAAEPHSFSRVFSGAFLRLLAGIFAAQPRSNSSALLQTSRDAGQLLVTSIAAAPVVPTYYSQVAAHMLEADAVDFSGRYSEALKSAFVHHGVLSLDAAGQFASSLSGRGRNRAMVGAARAARNLAGTEGPELPQVALPGETFGLALPLLCHTAGEPKRFAVAGAAFDLRSAEPPAQDHAAASFVDSLFKRGRIDLDEVEDVGLAPRSPLAHKTHALRAEGNGLALRRLRFDCGFCAGAEGDYHQHDQDDA